MARRRTLTLLGALALCACGGGGGAPPPPVNSGGPVPPQPGIDAVFEPPAFDGALAVGTKAFHWVDAAREETATAATDDSRELMVHLFYPADTDTGDYRTPVIRARQWTTLATQEATPGRVLRRTNYDGVSWPVAHEPGVSAERARWPVLIFSHGGSGAIERHVFLIGELVSRGMIVAAVNHTYYADFVTFPDGRVITGRGFGLDSDPAISADEAARLAEAQSIWSADQRFVLTSLIDLDQQPGSDFTGRLDLSRVAAGGFSFGGAASVESAAADARILGVVEGDGTIWAPDSLTLLVPLLFVQSGSGMQLNFFNQVFAPGYAALFDGNVTHLGLEDTSLWWRWDHPAANPFGSLGGEPALRAFARLSAEFLFQVLDGTPAPVLIDDAAAPDGVRILRY